MRKAARLLVGFGAFLLLSVTAKTAYGDSFDLSWTGGYGPGTAVLTATNDGQGMFTVTAITGTQNGASISPLLPPITYGGNLNFIYTSSAVFFPSCPIALCVLDDNGLAFSVGSTDYNLFFNTTPGAMGYAECSSAVTGITGCLTNVQIAAQSVPVSSLTLTAVSASGVPEPSSLILLSAGLLVFVATAWRKRRAVCSAA